MPLHQRLAAHLILLQRTAWTAHVGHLLAAATIQRLVAVITVLGHLVDHGRAVVQGRALGAKGALRGASRLAQVGAGGHRVAAGAAVAIAAQISLGIGRRYN